MRWLLLVLACCGTPLAVAVIHKYLNKTFNCTLPLVFARGYNECDEQVCHEPLAYPQVDVPNIGCFCPAKNGFRKTPAGDCVPEKECPPPTHKCPENEIYRECGVIEQNCTQWYYVAPAKTCKPPGCYCDPHIGYRRAANGTCQLYCSPSSRPAEHS